MQLPDRQRWGDPSSYNPEWGERSRIAAALVPDRVSVLEIGVGTGAFRDQIAGRTNYLGADLQPLDPASIALDLDSDPVPAPFDYAVLLGVFGYLHHPQAAAKKLCDAAAHIVVSYCCRRPELEPHAVSESWQRRKWVNSFTRAEFIDLFTRHGHELTSSVPFNATDEFEQYVMVFRRATPSPQEGSAAPPCDTA